MDFTQYKDAEDFLDKHPGMDFDQAIRFLGEEINKLKKARIRKHG